MSDVPRSFGVVLFPGFQALDVFGPLDCLNILSLDQPINLSIIAATLDPVPTKPPRHALPNLAASNFSESVVPTHTFEIAPPLDVLIIPGGLGTRLEEELAPLVDWLKKVYPSLKYIFTVCTGSWLLARAGILDGKRATSNKRSFASTKKLGNGTIWVKKARWVVDGNIWTTSGVSAGIDGMLAFIAHTYGQKISNEIAVRIEYEPHRDPNWDPFADIYPD